MQYIRTVLMSLSFALSLLGCLVDDGTPMAEVMDDDSEPLEIWGDREAPMAFVDGGADASAANVTEAGDDADPESASVEMTQATSAAAASTPGPAQTFVPSVNIGIKPNLDPKTYTSSSVIYDWDGSTCGGHRFDAYIKLYVGEATTAQAYVTKVDLHIKATSPSAFTMTPYFTDGSTVWQVSPISYELATNTWQTFTYDVPDRWFSLSGTTRFVQPVHPHDDPCGESTPRFYFKRG